MHKIIIDNEESIDNYKKIIEVLESEKQILKDDMRQLYMDSSRIAKENMKLRDELDELKGKKDEGSFEMDCSAGHDICCCRFSHT